MFDTFISYSSKDILVADAAKHFLEKRGIRCWKAPDNISLGQVWEEAIASAIPAARTMLLIWSSHSQNSSQVRRELSLAAASEKIIIPFRIEPVEPSGAFAYYLTNTHWLDALNADLEQDLNKLASQVSSILSSLPKTQDQPSQEKSISNSPRTAHKTRHVESLGEIAERILHRCTDFASHFRHIGALTPSFGFTTDSDELTAKASSLNSGAEQFLRDNEPLFLVELLVGKLGNCKAVLVFLHDGFAWIEKNDLKHYPYRDLALTHCNSSLGSAIELNKEWIFINTYAMECEATEIDKLIDYAISSDSAHRLQHMIKNGDFDKAREYILDVTGKGSELSRSSAAPPDAEELLLAIIEAGSGHPREAMKHLQDIKDNLKQNNGLDPEGWSLHIISDIEANLQTNL